MRRDSSTLASAGQQHRRIVRRGLSRSPLFQGSDPSGAVRASARTYVSTHLPTHPPTYSRSAGFVAAFCSGSCHRNRARNGCGTLRAHRTEIASCSAPTPSPATRERNPAGTSPVMVRETVSVRAAPYLDSEPDYRAHGGLEACCSALCCVDWQQSASLRYWEPVRLPRRFGSRSSDLRTRVRVKWNAQ